MISALLVSVSYVAAQMLADIASLQIVSVFNLSLDAGTFIYPITFTLRDLAHKVLGLKGVRTLIIAAAAINLFMAGFFWFVSILPPDTAAGSSEAWGAVLAPVWRITLASILAEIVAELLDTEAYRVWVSKVTEKYQWMRVLFSNAVSIPIDSLLFSFLAFYATMPTATVWQIFWGNVIIKGIVTLVSLPMIYLVKDRNQITE
ncbi:MAG: queuosine precursor transporter [Anaerolineaceae bacterium]|nr:queuosine precursor transporter [Anaerolineaceae bacterium]